MAPRAPSNWRRPYTSIYDDNYRYGSSLYSGTLSDIEKKYTDSLSKTQLRSDRPDLTLRTFADSTLTSSPTPGGGGTNAESGVTFRSSLTPSPMKEIPFKGSAFESRLNSAYHSSYLEDEDTIPRQSSSVERRAGGRIQQENPRPTSLYDEASAYTLPKVITDFDEGESKKRRSFKETASSPNGPNANYWKDKCRELQNQVDTLTQTISSTGSKVKDDLSTMKGKLQNDLSDLHTSVEQSSQQNNELQKTVKRQASQLMEYQSAYDDLHRQLQDALQEMGGWQRRSQTLRKEMDRLRSEVEETLQRSGSTSRT